MGEMLSPDEHFSDNDSTVVSSVTLPEPRNGWGSSSTSEETTSQSSRPSTLDELIGSPRLSPILIRTETSSEGGDFDQDTVISFNEPDAGTVEVVFVEENTNNRRCEEEVITELEKDSQSSLTEPSGTESEAVSAVASKAELHHLKKMVKKLKSELDIEKDSVTQLRKKLMLTNRDKLCQTSQFNDEMSLLKCENVALQARLEEQTVYTEQLEYELAKVRKKQKQDKVFADQREAQDTKEIEDLRGRLSETQSKLTTLEETLSIIKRETAEEIYKLKVETENKDSLITRTGKETEIAKTENLKLTDFIKEQESTMKEMLEKLQSTETELTAANAELSKKSGELTEQKELISEQLTRLQDLKEQCESLSTQLTEEKLVTGKLRSTTDSLESRAVQLECALNGEKANSGELRSTLEVLRLQYSRLEETQTNESRELCDSKQSVTRSEKELASLKKQLQVEKEDKRDVVGKLKRQLDVHEEHMKKLKADLAAANRHQKYMEQISQKIVKDLQPIFNGFPLEGGETILDTYHAKSTSEERARNIFDTLYNTVTGYKRRLTSLAEEKDKAKALCDSLTKESASYKGMLYDKEKAYDECKEKLENVMRETERVSQDSTELEAKCATFTVDLETAKSHNQTLQSQCQSLKQEILQLKARYEREVDEKHLYLQHIHHLLTSDLDVSQGQLLGSSGKLSWNELSTTVTERLAAVLTELSNLRSQVYRLDESIRKGDSYMENMREEYSSKMDEINAQLAASIERNSAQWRAERSQLEDHYNNMMNENQNRQQKSQRSADEAWDKLRDSDEVNRKLEADRLSIQEKITLLECRQRALLCALALVSGSYFPLLARYRHLREQRTMLLQQAERFAAFKAQIGSLLHTLVPDATPSLSNSLVPSKVRLRLRRAVIVVLAVGRLRNLHTRNVICVRDDDKSMSLCWSTLDCAGFTEAWLIQWMNHTELASVASLCTKDILETVDKPTDLEGSAFSKRGHLQSVVSTCLPKLLRQLSVLYTVDSTPVWSTPSYSAATSTLSIRLLNGLNRTMSKVCSKDHLPIGAARILATNLQEKVLSFVQQLHNSETDRKRLKESVERLSEAKNQLPQYQEACADLESELRNTRKHMEKLVPAENLQDLMTQLQEALEREKDAQALLTQQGSELKQLVLRLEHEQADREHSEQSAKFALKTLNDQLDSKAGIVNNLSRQVSSLEGERRSIHDNLHDAETALKSAARDREAISNYVDTLTKAFARCSNDVNADMSRVLLSGELIPSGRAAPDLLAVQRLAQKFVESHTALQTRISALSTVTTEQLQEVSRLKQEMSLVCMGQSQQSGLQTYQYPSSGYASSLSPLKVGSDYSPARRSPAVLDLGPMKLPLPSSPHRMSSNRGCPSPRLEMSGNVRR
ncbi:coiled-coil domain-containing protein 171-like [Watersipora subatra]|uniref:coiled-coil domain-containing protein 171-like n=1 Tax=Watersipora subatra TaxID=2589382 RepID=UPI00355BCA3E